MVSSDIFGGFLFLILPSEVASPREKSRAEKIKIEISCRISLSMKGCDNRVVYSDRYYHLNSEYVLQFQRRNITHYIIYYYQNSHVYSWR